MIKSMTGFGRGESEAEGRHIEVEVKAFNHRYCDVVPHLPRTLSVLETRVRNLIRERFSRGRIEVSAQFDDASDAGQKLELDLPLAKEYYSALKTLQESLGIPGEVRLETLTAFREIFARKEVERDLEKEWALLLPALEAALNGLEEMRTQEGIALEKDFSQRLTLVGNMLAEIEQKSPAVLQASRDRLAERVQELSGGVEIDPARLAQEVAFLAERSDITEELVRARSHLARFRAILSQSEPAGRKLDFLLQEMNREVNTIGSKANDAGIAHMVVGIKSELEKLREQVQNIE